MLPLPFRSAAGALSVVPAAALEERKAASALLLAGKARRENWGWGLEQ